MTKIRNILDFFETFAPIDSAMDFDNVGLLVGNKDTVVKNVLLSLDITKEVVEEAKKTGCQLIISHHPVIFNPLKKLDETSVVYSLAKENIAAVCMHTNLDLSEKFGVNTCLAKALGVENIKLCENSECLFIGNLSLETSIEEFAKIVKKQLNCLSLRYTDTKKSVKKIAVSSGAGGSSIYDAYKYGADVLVTGEIKHHEIIFANEKGIDIIDAGHFKTEDVVINPLKDKLSDEFEDVKFTKSAEYTDRILFL